MKTLLWLDDYRNPFENDWLNFSPIGKDVNVVWVKSYKEFVNYITNNKMPDGICFDHDLGTEKTGYDCAKYLVDLCINVKVKLPKWNCQTSNPVGKENINSILNNFKKFSEK